MLHGIFGYPLDYFVWSAFYLSLLIHTWCFFRFFPRRRQRLRLVLGNVLVFFCLLGGLAWLAESYLRFLHIATDSFGVSLPARRWFAYYTSLNSVGCRDREWAVPKPAGIRRIAFVGDSFTYGWGIENPQDRFTDRLQALFDAKGTAKVEVMNVAKPGWNTGSQLQPIKDMIEVFEADEIVIAYVLNDIEDLIPTTDDYNPTRPPEPRWFNPDGSCLLDYLWRRIYLPRIFSVRNYFTWLAEGYKSADIWNAQTKRLREIAAFCEKRNVKLRMLLLPFIDPSERQTVLREIYRQVVNEGGAMGIETLDLRIAIEGKNPRDWMVSSVDRHPNEAAHEAFARAIWQAFYAE